MKLIDRIAAIATAMTVISYSSYTMASQTYILATGSTGGTSYFVGSAIAQVVNKHSEEVRIEVLPAGGTTETSGLILRGKAHFGILTPSAASDAYNGRGPFAGHPVANMRALWGGYYNYHTFIAPKDRAISSFADLKGKRVGLCPMGTTCSKIAIATLEAAGLTEEDVDGQYLSFSEQVDALADNKLDVAVMFGGVPGAALLNATSQMDIRFLSLTEEMQSQIHAANEHFIKVQLPQGTYRGQDEAVTAIGTEVLFVGASEVSPEAIEEMSEILYANYDELIATMPLMQFFTSDNPLTLKQPAIPRHEGFEQYLKEKGRI